MTYFRQALLVIYAELFEQIVELLHMSDRSIFFSLNLLCTGFRFHQSKLGEAILSEYMDERFACKAHFNTI